MDSRDHYARLALWGSAIIGFGIIDTATTHYALINGIADESNPIPRMFVETIGASALWPLKSLFMGGMYLMYRKVPDLYNIGIPIGMSILGILIALHNRSVIIA